MAQSKIGWFDDIVEPIQPTQVEDIPKRKPKKTSQVKSNKDQQ